MGADCGFAAALTQRVGLAVQQHHDDLERIGDIAEYP